MGARVGSVEHAHTLAWLCANRRAGPEALRRFQARKLRALIAHCLSNVAVYGAHWRAAGPVPAAITTPEDIAALPLLGKNDLRSCPVSDTLVDRADVRRLVRHMTSGSSGQPFTIYRSPREEHLLNLFRLRASAAAGLRLFDRIVRFGQLPLDPVPRGWPGRVRQALGIHREALLDGMAPAEEMIGQVLRLAPDVVAGYPSTLRDLADVLRERGGCAWRPRLVLCGGEILGTAARRAIEQGFSAPLVELYGAHEFNLLAWQCPRGDAYHVCDDNVLLEIVDEEGRAVDVGETGEVVATALHSYTMPFVRYRTGDLAVRGPRTCSCGAPFSSLRAIQGRAADYLRLPGGRRVHPYALTGRLAEREADWVAQHQIVQTDARRVVLNIRPGRPPGAADLQRLRAFGAGIVGPGMQFDVVLVDDFPQHPSGKFRPYVSLIDDAMQSADAAA